MPYVIDDLMFFHLPKTGGHSVWYVMEQHGGFRCKTEWGGHWSHHMTSYGARQKLGPKWDQYKKFTLVRNPWERAVSLYFGRNKINKHSPAAFARWMLRWRGLGKFRWNPHYAQTRVIHPGVTVFRLDDIDKLYGWMEDQLDITITEKFHHRTGHQRHKPRLHYRKYYNKELRDAVADSHRADIRKFGWTF